MTALPASPSAPAASFRDPAGQLFRFPGRIVRAVLPEARPDRSEERRVGKECRL